MAVKAPPAEPGMICPLHRKDVSRVCHKCSWYVYLRGVDPNTGREIDNWGCSIAWLPTLLIEGSQQTRQAGAAIESFRNAVVEQQEQFLMLAASHNQRGE